MVSHRSSLYRGFDLYFDVNFFDVTTTGKWPLSRQLSIDARIVIMS